MTLEAMAFSNGKPDDHTSEWTPDQLKQLEQLWDPEDAKLIAEMWCPESYQNHLEKYGKRETWTGTLFIRCRRAEIRARERSEERLMEKVVKKVVAEQKTQSHFATPWEKDLDVDHD